LFAKENDVNYNTTLDQQVAILKKNAQNAFESAELQYETTITNAQDTLFQIDLAKTMAQEAYDLALRNKEVQLSLLNVGIRDAQVNLASAQQNYAKLTITSPINAIVSDILVDR
jgi:multidrug efflux pump subunit AcrA (membrane-fusion protein)